MLYKHNNEWASPINCVVKKDDNWVDAKAVFKKVDGEWKEVYSRYDRQRCKGPYFSTGYSLSKISIDPNNKSIYMTGNFATIHKLDKNGYVDNKFCANNDPAIDTINFNIVKVFDDGKQIYGGGFNTYKDKPRNRIFRLNADGTEDVDFYTNLGTAASPTGSATYYVSSIGQQSDGKLIIGGRFTKFNGITRNHITRLNYDGTEDSSFYANLPNGVSDAIGGDGIEIQNDDKILICGSFLQINGANSRYFGRINADGSPDTAFNANIGTKFVLNYGVSAIKQQNDKILVGGGFTNFNGVANYRLMRFNNDGTVDTDFTSNVSAPSGANNTVYSIDLMSNGNIVIGGAFTSFNGNAANRVAILSPSGSFIAGYTGTSFGNTVYNLKVDENDNIYMVGEFETPQLYYAKLFPDLSRDTDFYRNGTTKKGFSATQLCSLTLSNGNTLFAGSAGTYDNGTLSRTVTQLDKYALPVTSFSISSMGNSVTSAIQLTSDNGIILAGSFTSYNSILRGRIIKISENGQEDSEFRSNAGTGFNNTVETLTEISGGHIFVGGQFTSFKGTARSYISKLSPTGIIDTTFYSNYIGGISGVNTTVYASAVQSDYKILVGGNFTTYKGNIRNKILRLNPDGSEDSSFYTSYMGTGFAGTIYSFAVQPDGKILVGGPFTSFNDDTNLKTLIRFNSDLSLDTTFNSNLGGFTATVGTPYINCIVVQPDGKIIIGGRWTTINGITRINLARLNADGTFDHDFNNRLGRISYMIEHINLQPDGKIIVTGYVTIINDRYKFYFARIHPNGYVE